jgi:hypothetical protein
MSEGSAMNRTLDLPAPLHPLERDRERAQFLMSQYADVPMDFADASLVVAAEWTGLRKILTLDRHFFAYRIDGDEVFDVIGLTKY